MIFEDLDALSRICGPSDRNLKLVAKATGANVSRRGDRLLFTGQPHQTELAEHVLAACYEIHRAGHPLYPSDIEQAIRILSRDRRADLRSIFLDDVLTTSRNFTIHPRGPAQKAYVDAIRANDIVFASGPAGTGKTYLAMAVAIASLEARRVRRIVLVRPAVEAGEKLGFLPGDIAEKVNPYLRPLYDALNDMLPPERARQLIETGVVEVAPLAFMRGRTLNDAFIILDEAQNTTPEQMKMFLTRLGYNSKAVVTGDTTQIDLPRTTTSGLVQCRKILVGTEGIVFIDLPASEIVRHPVVQAVVEAYDRADAAQPPLFAHQHPLSLGPPDDSPAPPLSALTADGAES